MAFLATSSNVRLDLSNGGCVLIASCTKRDQTVRESRLDLNELLCNRHGVFTADGPHFAASAKNIRLEGDNLVCDLLTGSASGGQGDFYQGDYYCAIADTEWGTIPGKAKGNTCWYSYGGLEHFTSNFTIVEEQQLFTTCDGLVAQGNQNDGQGDYYCAIADTEWGKIPGKAKGQTCWYPYGGKEHFTQSNFKFVGHDPHGDYQERKLDLNARIMNHDGQLVWIRTMELPNVRASNADDLKHLWAAIDTFRGVTASLELTWLDQGFGNRKGHIHARKDGGAWEGISTDAAEHEETRESFEIPAKLLGGKLELGYSVGAHGDHKLIVKAASVVILTPGQEAPHGPWHLRILRPMSAGIDGQQHHLHLKSLEVYDQTGAKLSLTYNGNASEYVKRGQPGANGDGTPANVIDGNLKSGSHDDTRNSAILQDHWMEFDIAEASVYGSGTPTTAVIGNPHFPSRLAGASLILTAEEMGAAPTVVLLMGETIQTVELA